MKVGIDAFALGSQLDGSQTYVRNLIRSLASVDPDGDYTLLVSPSFDSTTVPGCERMKRVELRQPVRHLRLPLASSWALHRAGVDVFHAQFAAPLLCGARIVVTVHDILFERYPQFFNAKQLRQLRLRVPLTVRRAAAVVTGSEFSKQDILRRYLLSPEQVIVAPYAADPMFRPIREQAILTTMRERYGTGDRYVLFVGALKPNKNLHAVLDAYLRLRRSGAVRHRLVLVGSKDTLQEDVFANGRAQGFEEGLIFTGHVPDEDLVALYSGAELFVQPSLFEGFGLPSLEAMACGTPVITSNRAAVPEVVGDAAILVDPLDVEALAVAMNSVLCDEALRARLTTKGLQRAAAFSWQETARIVAGVYRHVWEASVRKRRGASVA